MNVPEVYFSDWRKFQYRDRISEEMDIPASYGLMGVYLLASPLPLPSDKSIYHLAPEIIYIGMSSHVTNRLDRSHNAVIKYKNESGDANVDMLCYSEWLSPWSNMDINSNAHKVRATFIHYIERKLIWEFANQHGLLPKYNRY